MSIFKLIQAPQDLQPDPLPPVLPEPDKPATEKLRGHLERAALALRNREQRLELEISDRQAELFDVRRAMQAAAAGLMELDLEVSTDEA